jgi:hypothetical protein
LPAIQQAGEIRPRVFIQTLGGAGRAVFADYAPALGTLGMPADAHRVITVGAADLAGHPEPDSAGGPPHNLELLPKPNVLAYDGLERSDAAASGTGLAAGFAAGLAASALSAGAPRGKFLEVMQVPPGSVLRIPPDWVGGRRAERAR